MNECKKGVVEISRKPFRVFGFFCDISKRNLRKKREKIVRLEKEVVFLLVPYSYSNQDQMSMRVYSLESLKYLIALQ